MAKGRFISFEGVECTGKSTQVRLLKKYCDERGINAITTREPGGSPYAEEIRSLLLKHHLSKEADAITKFFLFWAARAEHLRKTVIPALKLGYLVITDRFDGTTFSHQIYGEEVLYLKDLFLQSGKRCSRRPFPIFTLFLIWIRGRALRESQSEAMRQTTSTFGQLNFTIECARAVSNLPIFIRASLSTPTGMKLRFTDILFENYADEISSKRDPTTCRVFLCTGECYNEVHA